MASYSPVPSYDSEESKHPLIEHQPGSEPQGRAVECPSHWTRLGSFGLSILALATSALLLFASLDVPGPRDARGLLKKTQYPNLEMVPDLFKTKLGACDPY